MSAMTQTNIQFAANFSCLARVGLLIALIGPVPSYANEATSADDLKLCQILPIVEELSGLMGDRPKMSPKAPRMSVWNDGVGLPERSWVSAELGLAELTGTEDEMCIAAG